MRSRRTSKPRSVNARATQSAAAAQCAGSNWRTSATEGIATSSARSPRARSIRPATLSARSEAGVTARTLRQSVLPTAPQPAPCARSLGGRAKRSSAATAVSVMPGSPALWPASSTTYSSLPGHARDRYHATSIGPLTSRRPWMSTPGMPVSRPASRMRLPSSSHAAWLPVVRHQPRESHAKARVVVARVVLVVCPHLHVPVLPGAPVRRGPVPDRRVGIVQQPAVRRREIAVAVSLGHAVPKPFPFLGKQPSDVPRDPLDLTLRRVRDAPPGPSRSRGRDGARRTPVRRSRHARGRTRATGRCPGVGGVARCLRRDGPSYWC